MKEIHGMMMEDKPHWVTIPDYEMYDINQYGQVRSWIKKKATRGPMQRATTPCLMCPNSFGPGYLNLSLTKGRRAHPKHKNIHRLLGCVFIPNPLNLPEIDHIDRDPCNNHLSNLRWASSYTNRQNRGIPKNNKSGIKGVCRVQNRWRAYFQTRCNNLQVLFDTEEEAIVFRKWMEDTII